MNGSRPRHMVPRRLQVKMAAEHYNPIRLAVLRLGGSLKVVLPGMRGFEMLLGPNQWLLRDHKLDDQPLVAWSDFHPQWRDALDEPVICSQLHYHAYGAVLARNILGDVADALQLRLQHQERWLGHGAPGSVVTLLLPSVYP